MGKFSTTNRALVFTWMTLPASTSSGETMNFVGVLVEPVKAVAGSGATALFRAQPDPRMAARRNEAATYSQTRQECGHLCPRVTNRGNGKLHSHSERIRRTRRSALLPEGEGLPCWSFIIQGNGSVMIVSLSS